VKNSAGDTDQSDNQAAPQIVTYGFQRDFRCITTNRAPLDTHAVDNQGFLSVPKVLFGPVQDLNNYLQIDLEQVVIAAKFLQLLLDDAKLPFQAGDIRLLVRVSVN
jgi:hypothetical protein